MKILGGNFSLMILLLPLEKSSKKVSSLHLTLYEFKENLSIPHAIIDRKLKNKEFSIWRQDDINVKKELDCLNNLYIKHDPKRWDYLQFEVTEYISVTKVYPSTYVF